MGWGPSEARFGITTARRPRGPLDVLVVEDDEGRLGVGGQGSLEGVPLGKKSANDTIRRGMRRYGWDPGTCK